MASVRTLVSGLPNAVDTRSSNDRESDGNWSSFALRVGTPGQPVRVLISTTGQSTWVVSEQGCPANAPMECKDFRGDLFAVEDSRTWIGQGNKSLDIGTNLYHPNAAAFGLDTVALGFTDTNGGPTLENQVLAAITGSEFMLGTFGLGSQPTNLTNFSDPHPSFLGHLYDQHLIPSLSWGYTAGAMYHAGWKGALASLTFGGFDSNRFYPNSVSFNMASDSSRDLVVGLHSITSLEADGTTHSLLSTPHLTFIDSTFPYIWLPQEACESFERAFGLVYCENTSRYLVNDTLHEELLSRNLNFSFRIGNTESRSARTVDIVLPYSSFDTTFWEHFDTTPVRYFPLQRAANDTQYTLGRAFLQEAYLVTDYERRNFTVSQCRFDEISWQSIVPILSSEWSSVADRNSNSTFVKKEPGGDSTAWVLLGTIFGFVGLVTIAYSYYLRYQRRKALMQDSSMTGTSQDGVELDYRLSQDAAEEPNGDDMPDSPGHQAPTEPDDVLILEIARNSMNLVREIPNTGKQELAAFSKIFELSPRAWWKSSRESNPRCVRKLYPEVETARDRRIQYALRLSIGGLIRLWLGTDDPNISRSQTPVDLETRATLIRQQQSYLDKPLPTTPISESPASNCYHAWNPIGARRNEQGIPQPAPLNVKKNTFQHQREYF
ncbi:MAG: hypothetical protein Q9209_002180 [Squamulea sp. 1 TL-2023]